MVEPGDWTGPGGAQQILARRDIDVAVLETARGGIVLRGDRLRVERGERPDQRLVRPPRPAGHPHPARAGRGQVDDLPDHQARRLGRPQRRRPARRRRRAPGPRAGSRSSSLRRRRVGRRPAPSRARRPRVPRPRRLASSRPTASATTDDRRGRPTSRSRSAGWPATTWPTRWPPPAARAALGATIEQVRDGLRRLPPDAERSPGRLNLFRLGARVVIVDFAHNEAGRRRGARRGRGDRRRARPAGRRRSPRSSGRPATGRTTRCAGIGRIAAQRAQRVAIKETLQLPARPDRESVVGELLAGVVAGGGVRRPTSRSTTPRPRRCAPSSTAPPGRAERTPAGCGRGSSC